MAFIGARPARDEALPDTPEIPRLYLITLITLDRRSLFHDWPTARPIINALKKAKQEGEANSSCWVVMPDHLHWLIEFHFEDLPKVISRIKSRPTVSLNRHLQRNGRDGKKAFITEHCDGRRM